MRKQIKKLTLNRETLQNLETAELKKAAGQIEATKVSDCFQCSQYWTQCFCTF